VLGKDQHPLFAELTRDESGQPVKVKWNFEKFVINRDGELVARFPSSVEPDAQELVDALEKALS
jgi:glutathione peroxidase